ncbi:hypothetical protein OG21DRAFT_468915 [Imleria badia]|nr:hypothetical protein OG21DRAFT_468915 [Imleria badia]
MFDITSPLGPLMKTLKRGLYMDPSAPQTVLKGVAITSSLCGVAAGLYGGFTHGAPSKFLLYSAVNSGIVATTFFSIREYVVSPIMVLTLPGRQYQLRRQRLFHSVGTEEPTSLSWADIRASRLLDSGISGGLTGGILNTWKRGRRGLAPGLTTGALMCTLLQWGFNEFNIFRIRHVSANSATPSQGTSHGSTDSGESSSAELSTSAAMQPSSVESPISHSPVDRLLSMFGQRVSDEKYLEKLKMERDSHLRRIAELEEKKQ